MRQDNIQQTSRGQDGGAAAGGRIDWRNCTILPTSAVAELAEKDALAAASLDDNARKAIQDTVQRMSLDDKVPLYVATVDGQLVHANEGYSALAKQCEFFRPQVASQLTPTGDATARERLPDSLIAILDEIQLTRRSTTVEEKLKVGNSLRHYRSRHFPIMDQSGRVVAIGGTYVDCTEQMESLSTAALAQQRFKDFARASSDWFWEADRGLTLTYLSDRLTALVGKPTVTLLGKHLSELGKLVPDAQDQMILYRAFDRRVPFRDQLVEMEDFRGARVFLYLSGVPIFNADTGEFEGYRGAGMDVTSRLRVTREALEVRERLEKAFEELTNKNHQLDVASATAENALATKNEFLAGMSHELRTPLNAIIGFAEAMKMQVFGELNPHYVSYSEDIMNAGRHLLGLINDVLDVAVLENNKIKLDPELVPLKEIVDAALNLVIMRSNQKGQDTSAVRVDPKWHIYVDVRRATQVLVNLLSNAVKFTPEKGKIGIDVAPVDNAAKLAVTVWDSGIGIRENEIELVFEKFHQSKDSVYSRKQEGTGLGLHISRQLAELMGGSLTLKSEYGRGSRFTVTFPYMSPDE